jgi:arsenite transporter
MTATAADTQTSPTTKLSALARWLPVWIGLAMAAGLLLGRLVPDINTALSKVAIDGISLPIAAGC